CARRRGRPRPARATPEPPGRRRGGRAHAGGRGRGGAARRLPGCVAARGSGSGGERHDQLRRADRASPAAAASGTGPAAPRAGVVPRGRGLSRLGGHAGADRLRSERAARGRRDGAARRTLLPLPAPAEPTARDRVSLLAAEGVRFGYGARTVLDGGNLAIERGEVLGLGGPRG